MTSKWQLAYYMAARKREWDDFVACSRNGTFLFMRDYMDYHADRFNDCSLMAYYDNKLTALLPGNVKDGVFYSHKGLTYGGVVTNNTMKSKMMIELFDELVCLLRENGIKKLVYSPIPYIYARYPSEEDLYALFHQGARLAARKISTAVCSLPGRIKFSDAKKRNVRRAEREGLVLCHDEDFDAFWNILVQNLKERYDAAPIHTLEEIKRLYDSFPSNIALYRVCNAENLTLAGCVMYLTERVAHVQYISSTEEGREKRAVDFLFDRLINEMYRDKTYFDLGTSVEGNGSVLNEGLIYQKEGFGGRAVVYDTYELDI